MLDDLAEQGADVIVCTSPAIAGVAERVGAAVPVLRVDRPVAKDAVASARRIGVVSALASALVPTMELLKQEAANAGAEIEIVPVIVAGAWMEYEAGEEELYAEAVAKATSTSPSAPTSSCSRRPASWVRSSTCPTRSTCSSARRWRSPPRSNWPSRPDHTQPFSVASRSASARFRAPSLPIALLR